MHTYTHIYTHTDIHTLHSDKLANRNVYKDMATAMGPNN